MTKSQNTKNEQQKDLCITSEQLTEKWVNIYKSKKHGDSYWTGAFCYKTKEEAVKDLADKENYLTTVNIENMLNLQAQNAQLKELLKECREEIGDEIDDCTDPKIELFAKITEVLK